MAELQQVSLSSSLQRERKLTDGHFTKNAFTRMRVYLAMQVVSVEDLDPSEHAKMKSLPFRQRWVEALDANDLIYLEDQMDELEPGIDTRIYPECPQCSYVNQMTMPLTAEFFRPRRAGSRNG